MNHQAHVWRRPVLRVLLLALAVAAAPLPSLAGETTPPAAPSTNLTASIEKAVANEVVAVAQPPTARAQQTSGAKTDLSSKSFFKSKAGILCLVVAAVGVGYTLYSTSHDRITSPKVSFEGGVR